MPLAEPPVAEPRGRPGCEAPQHRLHLQPRPWETTKCPCPSTLPPPWCATREMPREIPEDLADMSVEKDILATGIMVIDLPTPYYKGDKTGPCQ